MKTAALVTAALRSVLSPNVELRSSGSEPAPYPEHCTVRHTKSRTDIGCNIRLRSHGGTLRGSSGCKRPDLRNTRRNRNWRPGRRSSHDSCCSTCLPDRRRRLQSLAGSRNSPLDATGLRHTGLPRNKTRPGSIDKLEANRSRDRNSNQISPGGNDLVARGGVPDNSAE